MARTLKGPNPRHPESGPLITRTVHALALVSTPQECSLAYVVVVIAARLKTLDRAAIS